MLQSGPKQASEAKFIDKELDRTASLVNNLGTPISPDPNMNGKAPASPFDRPNAINALTEGQTTIINNQAFQQLPHGISVAGTTLTPGARTITVSNTPILFGSWTLAMGTSTAPLLFPAPEPMITTVTGHAITAAPDAIEVAGTTLHPGVPGVMLGGTVVLLDTDRHLILGSKTFPLPSESAGGGSLILGELSHKPSFNALSVFIATIAGQVVTAAPTAIAFAGITLTPGAAGETINGMLISLNIAGQMVMGEKTVALESNGPGLGANAAGGASGGTPSFPVGGTSTNGTGGVLSTSVTVFQGEAAGSKSGLGLWKKAVVVVVIMVVLLA